MRFSKIYQKSKKLENRNFFKKRLDKYPRLCYNNYSKRNEVIKMKLEKITYDKGYPYILYDGWGGKVCLTEEDLQDLLKIIKKTLTNPNDYGIIRV